MDDAGLHPWAIAADHPTRPAATMVSTNKSLSYAELGERSRNLAGFFDRAGLQPGDHLAVLLENCCEFFVTVWAGLSSGLYVTPLNWHLASHEAVFIAEDCGAKALVSSATLAEQASAIADQLDSLEVRLTVGGPIDGFTSFDEATTHAAPQTELEAAGGFEACAGQWMFYSSGTTGRPKGIVPGPVGAELGRPQPFIAMLTHLFAMSGDSRYLSPAPLYHAAPAGWTAGAQALGASVVVMESFDAEGLLRAIEEHRITHLQVVPTHFIRMLKLPAEVRARYDLSSLEVVVHAAAPCPVEVKRAIIDWLGPIVYEYYAGSEGNGFCVITSPEWLERPGSVGRSLQGAVHITDEDGVEVPLGTQGQVWFETARRFRYHRDDEKTAAAWDTERGWSTLGDVGRVDDDGYLYLTDRVSNLIISGGVNIYPREVEDVLICHPAVADVAVIGTPDPDMGEQVTAYVQLEPDAGADPETISEDLLAWCRSNLSHFKCPRQVHLVDSLPRLPTGKLLKRLLR